MEQTKSHNEIVRYLQVVMDGCAVQIKQLSLTHLNPNFTKFNRKEYQVFCDDYRLQFCEQYDDLFDAVDKFVSIKNALYPRKK